MLVHWISLTLQGFLAFINITLRFVSSNILSLNRNIITFVAFVNKELKLSFKTLSMNLLEACIEQIRLYVGEGCE